MQTNQHLGTLRQTHRICGMHVQAQVQADARADAHTHKTHTQTTNARRQICKPYAAPCFKT